MPRRTAARRVPRGPPPLPPLAPVHAAGHGGGADERGVRGGPHADGLSGPLRESPSLSWLHVGGVADVECICQRAPLSMDFSTVQDIWSSGTGSMHAIGKQ